MFNVNGWELAIILVLALILFGPDRLPQAAAQAGRWLHHLQRLAAEATDDLAREFRAAAAEVDSAQGELKALERLVTSATDPWGQPSERAGESAAQSHGVGPAPEAAWPPPRPPSS